MHIFRKIFSVTIYTETAQLPKFRLKPTYQNYYFIFLNTCIVFRNVLYVDFHSAVNKTFLVRKKATVSYIQIFP